jgi:hypothetical protein
VTAKAHLTNCREIKRIKRAHTHQTPRTPESSRLALNHSPESTPQTNKYELRTFSIKYKVVYYFVVPDY